MDARLAFERHSTSKIRRQTISCSPDETGSWRRLGSSSLLAAAGQLKTRQESDEIGTLVAISVPGIRSGTLVPVWWAGTFL